MKQPPQRGKCVKEDSCDAFYVFGKDWERDITTKQRQVYGNMQYLVSASQMKEYDADTIRRIGIPSLVLMERAAFATAQEIFRLFARPQAVRTLVVAGVGNNGGDGLAIGRILQEYGYEVSYALIGGREKCSVETETQIGILENRGVLIAEKLPQTLEGFTVIVDALFGIGLSRELTGKYREAVEQMNASGAYIVSADIPSGIHADTGAVMGCAVRADLTVTYGYRKTGLIFYPGADYAGRLICRKIGISYREGLTKPLAFTYERPELAGIPARKNDGNKGSFGKVLVIAGSRRMYGACQFAALGAYRIGAGLVRVLTARENRELLLAALPEAIVDAYEDEMPEDVLEQAVGWADCVVAGPGVGTDAQAVSLLERIWELCTVRRSMPLVLDADGLNIIAEHPEWLARYTQSGATEMARDADGNNEKTRRKITDGDKADKNGRLIYFTPHMGEFARLAKKSIKCCKEERIETVLEYAKENQIILISKDARTVIADPQGTLFINTSGDNGMATGGSGDVLAGMLAGLLAQGMRGIEAAAAAVYLHGLCGNSASKKKTPYCVMAGDLLEELPEIMRRTRR